MGRLPECWDQPIEFCPERWYVTRVFVCMCGGWVWVCMAVFVWPRGCYSVWSAWVMGRLPEYWDQPLEFALSAGMRIIIFVCICVYLCEYMCVMWKSVRCGCVFACPQAKLLFKARG